MNKLFKGAMAFVLSAGMLAGCSSTTSSSAPATDSSTASVATSVVDSSSATEQEPAAEANDNDLSTKKVGICIYKYDDNFMTLFRKELESYLISQGFSKDNITITDGKNDQSEQTAQIQNFITQKVDVLIINPVNSSSAETITDMVVEAGIPLVYINREPDEAEQARWADGDWKVTYVGADARQSGTMQGEIIADLGLDAVDFNGNGKVDYVMIKGDPENVDAQYRTEYSIKALEDAKLEVNKVDEQVGMWDQSQGQTLVANSLAQYGNDVEVVFCNNDAMAMGAKQSIETAGRVVGKDIYLVGVDALDEACEAILEGTMTGTVFNDHISQSHSAADAAISFLKGETVDKKITCDYVKVTAENVQDIIDSLK